MCLAWGVGGWDTPLVRCFIQCGYGFWAVVELLWAKNSYRF